MKKFRLTLLAIASICLLTCTIANAAGNYFSKQHPLTNMSGGVKKVGIAPTEVIINNASINDIQVTVPAGGFTDIIYPRASDHIWNYEGSFSTYLILKDRYGFPFWSGTVCPHASITVYASYSGSVIVDEQACRH